VGLQVADHGANSCEPSPFSELSKTGGEMSPRVLIVAENASASSGGEAFIPLQYFRFFREIGVDVHLLVHERCRKELRRLLPSQIHRLHFVRDSFTNIWCYRIAQKIRNRRLAFFTVGAISHLNSQIRQRRLILSLVKIHHFEIIHEPTPVSPRLPSIMFGMPIPVVIGPMNGGMDFPPNYNLDGRFARFMLFVLKFTSAFWNILSPGKLEAALLLVANKRTSNALPPNLKRKQIREMVENGADLDLFKPMRHNGTQRKIRLIYVGALVDWKRVDLLIAACASLIGRLNFQLHLVGDGPERIGLKRQIERLSLKAHVKMHGLVSHAAVADLLRGSDIMVHPAMRECGGAVILEAMACGLPVIAADWGGPADYIDPSTGILVPPATPDKFVGQLADAILLLSKNPELRQGLGEAGRRRVQNLYDWRAKAKAMLQIYGDVLSGVQGSAARKSWWRGPSPASPLRSAYSHTHRRVLGHSDLDIERHSAGERTAERPLAQRTRSILP
jgi:glycosyltransferase involved in cell wall biosynthesis